MMKITILRLVASIVVTLLVARAARGAETWRMAGSFNAWNTGDPAWTLNPQGEAGQAFTIERPIAPGTYTFKFVKDGDWSRGHLGRGGDGRLEQPGDNLTLRITGEATYRIVLNLRSRSWSVQPIRVDRTHFDVRLLGPAVVDRPMLVDVSRTLTVDPWDVLNLHFEAEGGRIRGQRRLDRDGKRVHLMLEGAGPVTLKVTLKDAGVVHERTFDLNLEPEALLRYTTEADRDRVVPLPFESQGGGVRRALALFDADTRVLAMEVSNGAEVVRSEGALVPAGTYIAEIRDGSVVTQRDPSLPFLLIPGLWKRLVCGPRDDASTVHVVGDFNQWARPGQPGSIELAARSDGSFASIVDLPLGTHRYRFVLDGGVEVPDPRARRAVVGPGGTPASVLMVGPGAGEFAAPKPDAIALDAVRHDPASRLDFVPISRALGLADVALTTQPGDVEGVTLTVETAASGQRERREVPMTRGLDLGGFDRWSARIMTGEPRAIYSFTLKDGSATHTTPGYSASIEPAHELPAWAMGAVWYQIFPERFRNGNPLNDPRGPGVFNMPWTADWFAISPEEERAWRSRYRMAPDDPWPPRQGGNFFHVVWDRRYGGDLQGVAEKLEYLRDLGVTAIYLNPIFEAESMHKYDATDFRHIDDNLATPASAGRVPESFEFGGEPADPKSWGWSPADRYFVDEFLPAAKQRGIRVVLDGVFNHTGKPFFAFRDIEERGSASAFKDWFFVKFDESGRLASWESWFNTGALPKFRQTPEGDLVPPVKEYIFGITRRWMDPNGDGDPSDGIDGWRLDVALDVGQPFWRDWRALVKGINPDAVIIAEIWDDATPYLNGGVFDTQMHYPFAKPVIDWLGVKPGMTARALDAALLDAFDDLPQTNLIHQNLFGSHDTDRYVSMLQNPGRAYDDGNRPQDHDYPYKDGKPARETYRRSLLGVAMQALYLGAPMVYYGDEAGVWGADDPSDRKPYPWDDLPGGAVMKNLDERADRDLQKEYARWLGLRRDPAIGPVLRYGSTRHLESGDPAVFAFERALNGVRLIAVINRQDRLYGTGPLRGVAPGGPSAVPAESAAYWVVR